MKIIRVNNAPEHTVMSFNKGDLIWVSCYQLPFLNPLNQKNGKWEILCELGIVDEVFLNENNEIWGLSIFNNASSTVSSGLYIEDVIENYTKKMRTTNEINSANIIKKHYHLHYTIRKIMANRIKKAYILHYWNPTNPNMHKRLLDDFIDLQKQ